MTTDRGTSLHGKYLVLITVLVAMVMLIDGYDLQVMALLVAPMAQAWSVAPSEFGIVQSMAVGGLGIGAAVIAPLGDRFGRRRLVLAGFALVTVAVLFSGFSASIAELSGWRLLTGIALGATLVNASALLAELAPTRVRALVLTLAGSGITVGAMLSGLAAPVLIEHYQWPGAFWFSAGISAIFWVLLFFMLPEAPSFHQRSADRQRAVAPQPKPGFFSVLKPEHRVSTLALWTLFAGNAFLIYILVSWLPVLMTQHGWDLKNASAVIVYFQGGGLLGGIVVAALIDRWHPFNALLLAYAVSAVCFLGFGILPDSPLGWGLLFVLVGAGISGVHMAMNAIAAVVYPATMLSSGMGFTVAVARIGAIGAPLVGAVLIARDLAVHHFMWIQLVPLALCVASVLCLRGQYRRRAASGDDRMTGEQNESV